VGRAHASTRAGREPSSNVEPLVHPSAPTAPPPEPTPPAKTQVTAASTTPVKAPPPGARKQQATVAAFRQRRPGAWADSGARDQVVSTFAISPEEMRERLAASEVTTGDAPDADEPYLMIVSGERASVVIPLTPGPVAPTEWTVGRSGDLDVVIPDAGVSQLHARIVNDGKRWKVVDQLSANGTFVNNKRSHVSYLSGDDRLSFGPVECVFCLPGGDERKAGKSRWFFWALGVVVILGTLAAGYYYRSLP
jgi:hypothetical protein